jgi:hypothetical protein
MPISSPEVASPITLGQPWPNPEPRRPPPPRPPSPPPRRRRAARRRRPAGRSAPPPRGGLKQSTFCMARRKTMITMGSPYFVWINANEIISSWYLLCAVCVTAPPPRAAEHELASARAGGGHRAQGSVALPLCATAHPRHTGFNIFANIFFIFFVNCQTEKYVRESGNFNLAANIFAASISEPTMRPNPRRAPWRRRARRRRRGGARRPPGS